MALPYQQSPVRIIHVLKDGELSLSGGSHDVYAYVLEPVLLNALTLFVVAMLFNNLLARRRYPAAWAQTMTAPPQPSASGILPEHVRTALADMNMVEDISEDDLLNIIAKAESYAAQQDTPKI